MDSVFKVFGKFYRHGQETIALTIRSRESSAKQIDLQGLVQELWSFKLVVSVGSPTHELVLYGTRLGMLVALFVFVDSSVGPWLTLLTGVLAIRWWIVMASIKLEMSR